MKLDALAGNAALKRQLSAQAQGRGLSHAYLISGPAGSGKATLAKLLAAAMVCTGQGERPCGVCAGCKKALGGIHPDVIHVDFLEGKREILIEQTRQMRADAFIRPNEAGRKVYIVHHADAMNTRAQNSILKLLEEGPVYAAFLLLAENPGALLITVRSRCELLTLSPPTVRELEAPEETGQAALELLELIAAGDELALAQWCVGKEKWGREALGELIERETLLLRDALALQAGAAGVQDSGAVRRAAGLPKGALLECVNILEQLRLANQFNVGAGHLCGALCAGVGKAEGAYGGYHD